MNHCFTHTFILGNGSGKSKSYNDDDGHCGAQARERKQCTICAIFDDQARGRGKRRKESESPSLVTLIESHLTLFTFVYFSVVPWIHLLPRPNPQWAQIMMSKSRKNRGLYPAPLFHMESAHSTWNMFWLRSHPFWWFLSTYIPCGFLVDSMWIPPFHMEFPLGIHMECSTWIPSHFHVDSMWKDRFHVDSTWNPQQPILE